MKRFCTCLIVLCLAACSGKDDGPSVGGNNGDENNGGNNGEADASGPSSDGGPADVGGSDANGPDLGGDEPDAATDAAGDLGMSTDAAPDATADMTPDMGAACPARSGGVGDVCECDAQCGVGTCIGAEPGIPGFCSRACQSRQDCGNMGVCVPFAATGSSYCHPDDTGTACTTNTVSDPSKCRQNLCLAAGSNHTPRHFCSVECDDAADCGPGHACAPVRCQPEVSGWSCLPTAQIIGDADQADLLDDYPESRNLCVPLGAPNACANATDSGGCASSVCDPSTNGGPRCTAQCLELADCPVGGCVDRDLSNPSVPIRVCDLP